MGTPNKILSKELQVSENEVKLEKFKTELKKKQFIEEIKNGLGAEIKLNPRTIRIIKKPWSVKLKNFLGKIFTKF